MDFAGEFTFRVNETCLSSDHNIFRVAPTDRDAHNPILVHLKPSDMIWKAKRAYVPYEIKQRRREKRKATQKSNKRKGFGDGPSVDESWSNWDDTGYGDSSASSSWTWRPKNRWLYTSRDEENTEWFAQYSFSVSSFLFHKKRYTLLIARDNTKNWVLIFTHDGIYSRWPADRIFPECVARVPVSLWGSGLRVCSLNVAEPSATIRNRHFAWQAQHFRRVMLRVFCESHCQGCVKWRQGANSVAGVAFCEMWWNWRKPRTKHRFWGSKFRGS